jgi:hypothetical protein
MPALLLNTFSHLKTAGSFRMHRWPGEFVRLTGGSVSIHIDIFKVFWHEQRCKEIP